MDQITGRSRGANGTAAPVTHTRPDRKTYPELEDRYAWYGEVRFASASFIASFDPEIEGGSHYDIAAAKHRGQRR